MGVETRYPVSTLRLVGILGRNANKQSPSSRMCSRQSPARYRNNSVVSKQGESGSRCKGLVRDGVVVLGSS